MAKVDLADGYYRVLISPTTALSLAVTLPSDIPNAGPLIAIPLVLPLGWSESPPYFCAVTETITDMVNIPQYHIAIPNEAHKLLSDMQVHAAELPTEAI
jgi:hypothetical protein